MELSVARSSSLKPKAFTRPGVHPHLCQQSHVQTAQGERRPAVASDLDSSPREVLGVRSWATLKCTEPNIPGPRSVIRMDYLFLTPC